MDRARTRIIRESYQRRSESQSDTQDERGLVLAGVENIPGQGQLLEGESRKQASLDLAIGLVDARPLRHQAEAEPFSRRQRHLRPVVKETVRGAARGEEIL